MPTQPRIYSGKPGPHGEPVRRLVILPTSFARWAKETQQHFAQPDGALPKVIMVSGLTIALSRLDRLPPDFHLDARELGQQPEQFDLCIVAIPRWVAACQLLSLVWLLMANRERFEARQANQAADKHDLTTARGGQPPSRKEVLIRRTWRGGIRFGPFDEPKAP